MGLAAIASAALAIALLGIANALITSVSERTAEIGILKAIGATDRAVSALVLTEAAALGTLGGLLGTAAGWIAATLAAAASSSILGAPRLAPLIDLVLVFAAVVSAALVAVLAAWIPARRASGLSPADALRSD